jgi:hypothetical protein
MRRVSPQEQREERRKSAAPPKDKRSSRALSPATKLLIKQIAIEKAETKMLHLTCGHLGCREDTELFVNFRPAKNLWYCDVDGTWQENNPPRYKRSYPEVPEF